jgi:hypothetical protein
MSRFFTLAHRGRSRATVLREGLRDTACFCFCRDCKNPRNKPRLLMEKIQVIWKRGNPNETVSSLPTCCHITISFGWQTIWQFVIDSSGPMGLSCVCRHVTWLESMTRLDIQDAFQLCAWCLSRTSQSSLSSYALFSLPSLTLFCSCFILSTQATVDPPQ